jgi:ligand-binding sensor domain-containing protein
MRALCVMLLLSCPVLGQFGLFTCASITKAYVVGAKLPASGLFFKSAAGIWEHVGFNHPFITALDYDERGIFYLASGNGLIRASDGGRSWKILTGSDVTEVRDVAIDRNAPGTMYFAHTAGIRVTRDSGANWSDAGSGIRRKYTEAVRVDRTRAGHLVAGAQEGLYFSPGTLVATRRRLRFPGNAHRAISARSLLLARSDATGWNFRIARLRA